MNEKWCETDRNTYYYQLECVPPAANDGAGAFAAGEPLRITEAGAVHRMFVVSFGRYFTCERPLSQFNGRKFRNEVLKKF